LKEEGEEEEDQLNQETKEKEAGRNISIKWKEVMRRRRKNPN